MGRQALGVAEHALAQAEGPDADRGHGQIGERRAFGGPHDQPGGGAGQPDRAGLGQHAQGVGAEEPGAVRAGGAEQPPQQPPVGVGGVVAGRPPGHRVGHRCGGGDPRVQRSTLGGGVAGRVAGGGGGRRGVGRERHGAVGGRHQARVVGGHQHPGAVTGGGTERVHHPLGRLGVELGGGLVEEQEPVPTEAGPHQGPGGGEASSLAPREVAGRQVGEGGQVQVGQHRVHGVVGGRSRRVAQGGRFPNPGPQRVGALGHPRQCRRPVDGLQVAHGHAAQGRRTPIGDQGAAHHVEGRGLAGAARSGQRHQLAGAHPQVDRGQPGTAIGVGHRDPVGDEVADGRRGHRTVRADGQGERVVHVQRGVEPGGGGVEGGTHPADGQQALGGEEQDHQRGLQVDVATGEPGAERHRHHGHREGGEQFQHQGGQEGHPQRAQGGLSVAVGHLADALDLGIGPAEQAQGGQSREHVQEPAGQSLEGVPLAGRVQFGGLADEHHEDGDQRYDQGQDQGGERVGAQDPGPGRQRYHHRQQECRQVGAHPGLQGLGGVGGQGGHPGRSQTVPLVGAEVGHPVEHPASDPGAGGQEGAGGRALGEARRQRPDQPRRGQPPGERDHGGSVAGDQARQQAADGLGLGQDRGGHHHGQCRARGQVHPQRRRQRQHPRVEWAPRARAGHAAVHRLASGGAH